MLKRCRETLHSALQPNNNLMDVRSDPIESTDKLFDRVSWPLSGRWMAQFAALASTAKIFAFDPSPVTASSLVEKQTLSQNASELEIESNLSNR
jgi:hypothetical protein